ncbi:AraC-type DNA-binding protein [Cyclobacterium lianum]|uniref:AraC-type DNA-binding protein n=1 Tax=Cyclobacterium lianum TaxID=388280 RepID=A0A1M7PTV8_9BACT|nr:AraC family transcriptional regulator [Cyclobacterium lianum]SHN20796.1 AraC-type DNA-binding protein [Cyclobacterium lianum]
MDWRLENQDNISYLSRNISIDTFFRDSFIENSVQFGIVEIQQKEGKVLVSGSTFSNEVSAASERFEMGVSGDCPLLKFHFSLEGTYTYESQQANEASIYIPDGHCNMYYLPKPAGTEVFTDKKTKFLEIYVAPDYERHTLYPEFKEAFVKLYGSISLSKPFVLWEKSRPIPPPLINKINEIISCPYTGEVRKRYLESKLTALLIDFLLAKQIPGGQKSDVRIPEEDYLTLVKLEGYIRKNLKHSLNIIELAAIAGFNATKLKRDFKKIYGSTIFKYITGLRMEEARKMIVEDGISITQAAYEVGYSNPQHFTAAFKRTMGYLPGKLRTRFEDR